jgi:signal transduction histidine kinase
VQYGRRTKAFAVAGLGYVGYFVASVVDPFSDGVDATHLALAGGWMVVVLALSELARVKRAEIARGRQRAVEAEQARAEAERVRIAQDLHDVLAHHISLINVQSSVALHLIDDDPAQARSALANIKTASRDALRELRTALDLLAAGDAPRAPSPTFSDLDELIDRVGTGGLQVDLHVDDLRSAPAAVQLAGYRIVQEALTNATRHARATRVQVTVRRRAGVPQAGIDIVVSDDGVGPAVGSVDGRGLTGMGERATSLGGTFEAGAGTDGGYCVRAYLPMADATLAAASESLR